MNIKPVSKEGYKKGNQINFGNYAPVKSEFGYKEYEFSHPFDPERQNCYLEIYKIDKDRHNNYFTTGIAYDEDGKTRIKLGLGVNRVDLAEKYAIDDNVPFAYHYVIEDKNSKTTTVRIDMGDSINEKHKNGDSAIYNIVIPTESNVSHGGAMRLVIPDSQHVGWVYNKDGTLKFDKEIYNRGAEGVKSITNKYGGTLAGLEHGLDEGEYDNYERLISLPLFTDDDLTAHAYWNKNCFQMASSLGNINNYASFQRKMFAHGLNFVSDGAFVNEGLEGVHFKHLLKWGEDSPYLNWFRASGIKEAVVHPGVFIKNDTYTSHKVVNSPYEYTQKSNGQITWKRNKHYDSKKPTYIQYFDKRYVTKQEASDTKNFIDKYSIMSRENVYENHTHNDAVFPYKFEIDPEIYHLNIKNINEYNSSSSKKLDLYGAKAARLVGKSENFDVEEKFESGFETWDANPDIAKLNFVFSNTDTKTLKNLKPREAKIEMEKIHQGNMMVQDYTVSAGEYWTKKTDEILRLYVAQNLKNIDDKNPKQTYKNIEELIDKKIFPKKLLSKLSSNEVENVINGFYNNKRELSDLNKRELILQEMMNMPLDSIEFGDNLVGVLASPLISKRATTEQDIGKGRYEIFKSGNENVLKEYKQTYEFMDKIYNEELFGFVNSVLGTVDAQLENKNKLFENEEVTEFGKYVLPIIVPQITKYAIVKAFAPDIKINVNNKSGEISYDYNALKQVHLQTIGVNNPASVEDEASMVLNKLKSGLKNIDYSIGSDISKSVYKTLQGTDANSFKLADLIIDKTQSGLDWRIDATKDIADVESLRVGNNDFETTWNEVIGFWKKFTQKILSQNNNSYIVAEVTDEGQLFDDGYGGHGKYQSKIDIIQKFLRETGITSIANYSYLFTGVYKLFTKDFEDGSSYNDAHFIQKFLHNKLIGDGESFLKSGSLDSLKYSYTFIGNHDKPRTLHCAALDMSLFYTDLNNPDNYEYRLKAYQLINDKYFEQIHDYEVNNFDFSAVSPKAVAMGTMLREKFMKVLDDNKDKFPQGEFDKAFVAISKSISDLSQGKFLNNRFDPDAFGVKPIDVNIDNVLKQARVKYGLNLPGNLNKDYANLVFKAAVDPAISKLLGMMKYLVALPGMPTLFDGDDIGATGYDTKTKNIFLQGRQRIHDEWLVEKSPKYKEFIAKHKKEFDDVMKIRKMKECSALNDGGIFMLPMQTVESDNQKYYLPTILRQSNDGKMAISVLNTAGLHYDHNGYYSPKHLSLESLLLNIGEVKREPHGRAPYYENVVMDGNMGVGITGLKEGMIFCDAKNPQNTYRVCNGNGAYYLKSTSADGRVNINDSTMILYYDPKDKHNKSNNSNIPFQGRYNIEQSLNTVIKSYEQKQADCGKRLALLK